MTGRDDVEPVLELRDVRYAYPAGHGAERPVLRGVSLAVTAGEVVALMGPNGSGKTTLLRLAAGRLAADAGDVRLGGRPISEWTRREIAARVAVVPQVPILPEGFRVEELVEMGRAPHARSRFGASTGDAAAVERALSDAEATDLVGRRIDELSGGERQRVLVAMALAQEPQLLLLDEPTQHLDLAHQVSLLATLDRLRRARGVAALAVLHDPVLTRLAGPRVVLLRDGRVVTDAAADEALRPGSLARVFDLALPTAVALSGLRDGPD